MTLDFFYSKATGIQRREWVPTFGQVGHGLLEEGQRVWGEHLRVLRGWARSRVTVHQASWWVREVHPRLLRLSLGPGNRHDRPGNFKVIPKPAHSISLSLWKCRAPTLKPLTDRVSRNSGRPYILLIFGFLICFLSLSFLAGIWRSGTICGVRAESKAQELCPGSYKASPSWLAYFFSIFTTLPSFR